MITETELKLIARAAIMGDSNQPVKGYNTPAAIGMPSALYAKAKPKFCFMLATVSVDIIRAAAIPRKSPFTKVTCALLMATSVPAPWQCLHWLWLALVHR